jgi:predicted membrane chloride channel (bestrophin family)
LLLVFRTNASYSRWLEARQKFGSITTTGRDLVRQALWWFRSDDLEGRAALARWVKALARSSMCHLRDGEHDLGSVLQGELQPKELELLVASKHRQGRRGRRKIPAFWWLSGLSGFLSFLLAYCSSPAVPTGRISASR